MKLIHIVIFVFSMLRNHSCNEFVDDCTSPGMYMAQAIENSAMAIGCKTQNSFGFCILSHKESGAKCTIKFTKPNTYNDQGCHKSKFELLKNSDLNFCSIQVKKVRQEGEIIFACFQNKWDIFSNFYK